MLSDYTPVLLLFILAGGIALAVIVLSELLGPKNPNLHKADPFESGSEAIGTARQRFSVKFYLVALLFILFDIEGVFIVPWAVLYRELGLVGLVEMFVFIAILAVGLAYVWRKGGLEWD